MSDQYDSRATWGEPGMFDSAFRGRAGGVIEIAPNRYVQYVLLGTHGEIDIRSESEEVSDWGMSIRMPTTREVHMVLTGTLSSKEEAERPAWATAQQEISGRREIGR